MIKHRRLMLVAIVAIGVMACAIVWIAFLSGTSESDVATTRVQRGTFEKTVEATGTLEPKQLVGVGSQASGRVVKLFVDVGDVVKAGQMVAQIDSQPQTNSLKTAQADLANVKAQLASSAATLAQKRLALARQQQLGAGEATSQADFEVAQAEYRAAQASYDALQAQVNSAQVAVNTAQVNLGYTRITAPMDGVVVAVVTKQGQTVNAVQSAPTIVVLARLDVMTVQADISEADVINVKAGLPVYFTILGDPDRKYRSKLGKVEPAPESIVDEISSSSSSSSASSATSSEAIYYYALFDIANDGRLRALMTAKVTIVLAQQANALSIPLSALGTRNADGTYPVQVRTAQGRLEARKVVTGIDNNVNVVILSGLKEGEEVVVGEAKADSSSTSSAMGPGGF